MDKLYRWSFVFFKEICSPTLVTESGSTDGKIRDL